jgi:hypothetical protein
LNLFAFNLSERGKVNTKQFVDDAVIAQMQNAILIYSGVGRTIVLLTGDGRQ